MERVSRTVLSEISRLITTGRNLRRAKSANDPTNYAQELQGITFSIQDVAQKAIAAKAKEAPSISSDLEFIHKLLILLRTLYLNQPHKNDLIDDAEIWLVAAGAQLALHCSSLFGGDVSKIKLFATSFPLKALPVTYLLADLRLMDVLITASKTNAQSQASTKLLLESLSKLPTACERLENKFDVEVETVKENPALKERLSISAVESELRAIFQAIKGASLETLHSHVLDTHAEQCPDYEPAVILTEHILGTVLRLLLYQQFHLEPSNKNSKSQLDLISKLQLDSPEKLIQLRYNRVSSKTRQDEQKMTSIQRNYTLLQMGFTRLKQSYGDHQLNQSLNPHAAIFHLAQLEKVVIALCAYWFAETSPLLESLQTEAPFAQIQTTSKEIFKHDVGMLRSMLAAASTMRQIHSTSMARIPNLTATEKETLANSNGLLEVVKTFVGASEAFISKYSLAENPVMFHKLASVVTEPRLALTRALNADDKVMTSIIGF